MFDSGPISMETIASLFDPSRECVKMIDTEGRLGWMNAGGLCAMEISDFALVEGADWASCWPDEGKFKVQAALAASPAEPAHFTTFCPTAVGTPKWWDVSVMPLRDPLDDHYGYLATSRDVTHREAAKAARNTVLQEMRHRQGNQMTVASMLMVVYAARDPALRQFADDMSARLAALGRAQAVVGRKDGPDAEGYPLLSLMDVLVQPMAGPDCALYVEGGRDIVVALEDVDLVGVVLSELAVNSVKHGAFGQSGTVTLTARRSPDGVSITWTERAAHPVEGTFRDGAQGLSLMHRMAALSGAEFRLDWRTFGPNAELTLRS
ncbi:MAG: PAS domain-containing protein [Pseudomonadota bacterium]